MSWSLLTPKVRATLVASEAQRNEPGINALDACGPACASALMQLLGYPDLEPQDWVGPYYKGGTTGPQLNAVIASKFPNPPPMSYVSSGNPIADLATWASHGWLSMGLFWSDGAAVVKPYNTGIGHWCIPVEDDGIAITIWNPEWGQFNRLSHADFLAASWHQFDVCERSIPQEDHMDQAEFSRLVAGDVPTQANFWRVLTILSNLDSVPNGATKGEPNALKAAIDALKAEVDALNAKVDALKAQPAGSPASYQGTISLTPK